MAPLGIGVATGEMCANRVMFKQLMQLKAISYCQIDSARVGGVSEVLSIYLMAKKFGGKIISIYLLDRMLGARNFVHLPSRLTNLWPN